MRNTKASIERRISAAYTRACSGIQIDIMDTVKIMDAGHRAVAAGMNDDALEASLRAFVETLRRN